MSLNYVRFDVGHYLYVCHRTTIDKYPESVLARHISPEFDTRKSGDDYIVIDRDGKHFGSILNYMRDDRSLDLDEWSDSNLTDLMREADFYCLTQLVELCESQFEQRDNRNKGILEDQGLRDFEIPADSKIETVYGIPIVRKLLASSKKQTIVVSQHNMRKFHIDSWVEELVRLCDHSRFNVYCFADKSDAPILCDKSPPLTLRDFIVSIYNPSAENFTLWVSAPAYDKFRSRRSHYKCKIFKFWFVVQNDLINSVQQQRKL